MTQLPQKNDISDPPKDGKKQSQIVPVGEIIPNLTISSLMVMLRLLNDQTGIAKIETSHLSWRVFINCGSIVFILDKTEFLPTLLRKLKIHKVSITPALLQGISQNSISSLDTFRFLGEIYALDRENCLIVFKEILFENLLAIFLEKKLALTWNPLPQDIKIVLPTWQLADLEKAIDKVTTQWRDFAHVRHPYQTVQLLNTECGLAQVPLFTQVTNGKYRISEIADHFRQHISRTALKLDNLAENRTVAILPLPQRSLQNNENFVINDELDENIEKSPHPKVMIVDDSPVLLKQFGDLLTKWGYKLVLVEDSVDATNKMLLEKPNIVFMDINMPNLNGFDLIKQIRRQPSLATVPLVLVTSESSITNNFRAKWANCRFLSKPRTSQDIPEFREQVRAILQEFAPI